MTGADDTAVLQDFFKVLITSWNDCRQISSLTENIDYTSTVHGYHFGRKMQAH